MCITRSERVCDKGLIKRERFFIICVTFSLSNSPDSRLLCLIIIMLSVCLVCFQNYIFLYSLCFVFFLFRSALFYNMYVLFICTSLYVYINMYTHGRITQCIKK